MGDVDGYILANAGAIRNDIQSLSSSCKTTERELYHRANSLESHLAEVYHKTLSSASKRFLFKNMGFLHLPSLLDRFGSMVQNKSRRFLALYLKTLIILSFFVRSIQNTYVSDIFVEALEASVFNHADVCLKSFETAMYFCFLHRMWKSHSKLSAEAFKLFKAEIFEYINQAASGEMTPCRIFVNILFEMLCEFHVPDTQILYQAFKILHHLKCSNSTQNMLLKELVTYIDRGLNPSDATDMAVFIQNDGIADALDYIGAPVRDHIIGLFTKCCRHLEKSEISEKSPLRAYEQLTEFHLRLLTYFCTEYLCSEEGQSIYVTCMDVVFFSVASMQGSEKMRVARQTSEFFKRFIVGILSPIMQRIADDPSDDMKKMLFASSLEHFQVLLRHDLDVVVGCATLTPMNERIGEFFDFFLKIPRQSSADISFVIAAIGDVMPLLFQAIDHFFSDVKFTTCLQRALTLLAAFFTYTGSIVPGQNYRMKFILRLVAIRIKRCSK